MMTLDEIALAHGTDKASSHPNKGHGYANHYAHFFEPLRDQPIKLLEIGVGGGESIKSWLDYFSEARVFGVDIVHDTNQWNTPNVPGHPRYTFCTGDQTDKTLWKCFMVDFGCDWDIVIDDGGHMADQIQISFAGIWPYLKSGGFYCVEDLGVSYGAGTVFVPSGWPNHMDWLRAKLDNLNQKDEIDFMYFAQELVIIRKK